MPRYGIDTFILVRLLTGEPESDYEKTKAALMELLARDPAAEIEVSNMVIGEAYFVLQHHYKVSKEEARAALVSVMSSGLVKPVGGASVLAASEAKEEPGVMDRLIAQDYSADGVVTLTHDRKMPRLSSVQLLMEN